MKTICFQCKNHKKMGDTDIWYHQNCAAEEVRFHPVVDPVSGKKGYSSSNDFGMQIVQEHPYPFCRDINYGNCPYFKPKEGRGLLLQLIR